MQTITKTVAIIVAHPDDESLWCGGTILSHPGWRCFIVSLCRKSDVDRAPKFEKALKRLGAGGVMGNLDDGPEQTPLADKDIDNTILGLLSNHEFDLIITHSIYGEYTRHRRHEETGRAVIRLWHTGQLRTSQLWAFAFEDGGRSYSPIAIKEAPIYYTLPQEIWDLKYNIITKIYGFKKDSWEALCTPHEEAFWEFSDAGSAYLWWLNSNTSA